MIAEWFYFVFNGWDVGNYLALFAILSSALVSATVANWAINAKNIDFNNTFHQELIKRRLNAYDAMMEAAAEFAYIAPGVGKESPISKVFLDDEELWLLHQKMQRLEFQKPWLDMNSAEEQAFNDLMAFSHRAILKALKWDNMHPLAKMSEQAELTHDVQPLTLAVQKSLVTVYADASKLGELRVRKPGK